jgi:multidrug resistance protein MdtO
MEAVAQFVTEWPRPLVWFRGFLKEELAPYPGRAVLVARMVIAATLVMLITMTFRIPFNMHGTIFTFTISRESPRATLRAVRTTVIAFSFAAVYILTGATLSQGNPGLRFLWVIGSLFIMFYAIHTMTDYAAATGFGILIAITLPLWDMHIPAELKVEGTLWAFAETAMACGITLLVELAFAALRPGDDLVRSIAERLACVEELLKNYAADGSVDKRWEQQITHLSMVGTSRLRRLLRRSTSSLQYREQLSSVVALAGRLVDIAANLTYLRAHASEDDRKRMRRLAENIAGIRGALLRRSVPPPIEFTGESEASQTVPLLSEMERTVSLIPEAVAGSQSQGAYPPLPSDDPPSRLFVPDAVSSPDHTKFGLKGGLAASLCYIIYTSLDWPGISTAVVTCVLTELTTIGASHQKQVLRISGAIVGGFIFGMGAQIFVLPYLDSIGGLTLLFIAVTFLGAWFATSSPRLSYFGVQLALAFYAVNLQDFTIETSLTFARDRVVGILLALSMMWLVFDQLWGAPAIVEMERAMVSLLRSLAKLARAPVTGGQLAAIEQSFALRETINNGFDKVRALADGVRFEFGPTRQQALALRSRIIGWQPQLRMLFITRVALLRYRLQLPGFELTGALHRAQQDFDEHLARTLERMADGLESKPNDSTDELEVAFARLTETVRSFSPAVREGMLAQQVKTFAVLSERITNLALSLTRASRGSLRGGS